MSKNPSFSAGYSYYFLGRQRYRYLLCLCSGMLLTLLTFAQVIISDTPITDLSARNAKEYWVKSLEDDAPVFTGTEYVGYGQNISGHPFFENFDLQKGDIFYDGVLYTGIPLSYDLMSDHVLITDYDGKYFIQLKNEKIRYFRVLGHTFVRPLTIGQFIEGTDDGFYDMIYDGPSAAFVKRKKKISTPTTSERAIPGYVQFNTYYIRSGNSINKISNFSSLLSHFKTHKAEIKKFVRDNHLDFKNHPDQTIRDVAAYYDKLNHP